MTKEKEDNWIWTEKLFMISLMLWGLLVCMGGRAFAHDLTQSLIFIWGMGILLWLILDRRPNWHMHRGSIPIMIGLLIILSLGLVFLGDYPPPQTKNNHTLNDTEPPLRLNVNPPEGGCFAYTIEPPDKCEEWVYYLVTENGSRDIPQMGVIVVKPHPSYPNLPPINDSLYHQMVDEIFPMNLTLILHGKLITQEVYLSRDCIRWRNISTSKIDYLDYEFNDLKEGEFYETCPNEGWVRYYDNVSEMVDDLKKVGDMNCLIVVSVDYHDEIKKWRVGYGNLPLGGKR